jgi:hypothetical protein
VLLRADRDADPFVYSQRTLVVDEVSMISAEFFYELECMVRKIRSPREGFPDEPWGGVQLVLCGDFHQLPPIEKRLTPNLTSDIFLNRGYAFQSPTWLASNMELVLLTKVSAVSICAAPFAWTRVTQRTITVAHLVGGDLHMLAALQVFRQKNPEFVRILDQVRNGDGRRAVPALQKICQRPLMYLRPLPLFSPPCACRAVQIILLMDPDIARLALPCPAALLRRRMQHGVKPTQLYSRNADVDHINRKELANLNMESVSGSVSEHPLPYSHTDAYKHTHTHKHMDPHIHPHTHPHTDSPPPHTHTPAYKEAPDF